MKVRAVFFCFFLFFYSVEWTRAWYHEGERCRRRRPTFSEPRRGSAVPVRSGGGAYVSITHTAVAGSLLVTAAASLIYDPGKKNPKKIKTRREYTHISPRVIGCASMPVASVDCFLKKQKKKSIESSFSCVGWTIDEEIFWFRQPKRKCEWCNSFILGLIFFLMIVIFIKLLRDSWMLHSRNRRLKKKTSHSSRKKWWFSAISFYRVSKTILDFESALETVAPPLHSFLHATKHWAEKGRQKKPDRIDTKTGGKKGKCKHTKKDDKKKGNRGEWREDDGGGPLTYISGCYAPPSRK